MATPNPRRIEKVSDSANDNILAQLWRARGDIGKLPSSYQEWELSVTPVADKETVDRKAIESIGPDTVHLPAPKLPRSELARAYGELGAMLGRLQSKLRSERAFSAHAAHSLRTPLAGLTAQIEVASTKAPAEIAHRLSLATDAAHRFAGVVDALLTMARTTEGVRWRSFDATELATIAAGPRIDVDATQLAAAGTLLGDSDLLAVAVANLVDNAERHGAQRVRVRVRGTRSSQQQCIEIEDDGPGASPERLALIDAALERFETKGEIDTALGLGLTLAASVARAHRGCLSVQSSPAGWRGFVARLEWPSEPSRAG